MANAFDTSNAPQGEPLELVAGDLITWRRDDLTGDYPTADYSLRYSFQCDEHAGGTKHNFDVDGSEDAAGYYVQITGATTLALNHYGHYTWQAYIIRTSDSARITIGSGQVNIAPDLDTQDNDARSHANIMLHKIQSLLEGRADADVASYSIGNRSLNKLSIDELLKWRDYYRAEYAKETRMAAIKAGKPGTQLVKVRF